MFRFTVIALLIITGARVGVAEEKCPSISSEMAKDIEHLRSSQKGDEYCPARKTLSADVDGDGKNDEVLAFTLEGVDGSGNNHRSFLAVRSSKYRKTILAQLGGRGMWDPSELHFKTEKSYGGSVVVDTLIYTENDPMCCPSGKGSKTFRLIGNMLTVVDESEE